MRIIKIDKESGVRHGTIMMGKGEWGRDQRDKKSGDPEEFESDLYLKIELDM